ncbi:MAG TPA: enoyl-CoA hydratase/isomerase family protein, partial [Micavibrio sp.]
YPKPLIALMDGITMGGGYGVAGYCDYKIATQNTRWAMPETGIGFFPDVGVCHELSRMPPGLGMFFALTGITVGGADAYAAGVATHYIDAGDIPAFRADMTAGVPLGDIVARYHQLPGEVGPVMAHHDVIARCFTAGSVAAIFDSLAAETRPWAAEILALLKTRSPLSLCVTFARMKRAETQDFDRVIAEDYVIARHFMRGGEFFEGVRAMLIDKDKKPRWQPDSLEKVTETAVSAFFAPLAEGLDSPGI